MVFSLLYFAQSVMAASFNQNNLISDSEFINISGMSQSEIQRFLVEQESYLQSFSENGRTAAEIIYQASHGHGEASGTIGDISINSSTGTVNPKVLLVTLQKEQSLISKTTRDDNALAKAMGYGCPDSGGCNSSYAGFTKQVENAAWQFRYNYERAQGKGFSDYQVGEDFCFNDWNGTHCGRFDNKATSALYRYTPHVYNGNYNFWNLYFNTYNFGVDEYQVAYSSWSTSSGKFIYPQIPLGGTTNIKLSVKNIGRETWTKGVFNLGTDDPRDRISNFTRSSGWLSPNRIAMQESTIAPGHTATFNFSVGVPSNMTPGIYRERFRLVADGVTWVTNGEGIYWDITVLSPQQSYRANVASWSTSAGAFKYPTVNRGGKGTNITLKLKNIGQSTWKKGVFNLGTDQNRDRISVFLRESGSTSPSGWISPNRITLQENSVAPGGIGTFSFYLKAPSSLSPGVYREHFNVVLDGVTWLENGIYWEITVR